MGHGLLLSVIFGLIIHGLINCHPRAQFFGPRRGGSRSVAAADSYAQGVNLGGLDLSSTLSNRRSYSNGELSGGISHDLGLGPIGIGTSLSSDYGNGIGLRQNANGGLGVGLGPVGFDLHENRGTYAETGAGASGDYAESQSQSGSRGFRLGPLGLSSAFSNSRATGIGGGRPYFRRRRRSATAKSSDKAYDSTEILETNASQDKTNIPLLDLFGKKMFSQHDQNEKQFENFLDTETAEKRTFESIFDLIVRMIAPTFYLASTLQTAPGIAVQTIPGVYPQAPGAYPINCCSSCYGASACRPGTGVPAPYPPQYPSYSGPGLNAYPPSNQPGGISYTSSSSTSSVGSGGPITVYTSSNSQSGIQAG